MDSNGIIACKRNNATRFGSTTTDCDKLAANQLTANNADGLRRANLNIFLLSPEPSCPNPHLVTKSLRRNHCNEIVALRSVCSWSVCRGQWTWLNKVWDTFLLLQIILVSSIKLSLSSISSKKQMKTKYCSFSFYFL